MVGERNVRLEIAHGCISVVEVKRPRHAAWLFVTGRCTRVYGGRAKARDKKMINKRRWVRVQPRLIMRQVSQVHTMKSESLVVAGIHMYVA